MFIQELFYKAERAGACGAALDHLRGFSSKEELAEHEDVVYWFNWLAHNSLLPAELEKAHEGAGYLESGEEVATYRAACQKWLLAQDWDPKWVPGAVTVAEATPIHSDIA